MLGVLSKILKPKRSTSEPAAPAFSPAPSPPPVDPAKVKVMGLIFSRDGDFDNALIPAAKRHDVPVWLAKGLIGVESGWNSDSVMYEPSHASTPQPGDRDASFGLMQVTGEVAYDYGAPIRTSIDASGKTVYDLSDVERTAGDPTLNLEYGMRELGTKWAKYGDAAATVAAYNMGYPRLMKDSTIFIAKIYDRWAMDQGYGSYVLNFEKWRANPPAGWVYANQPYVNRVLAYAVVYKADEEGNIKTRDDLLAALKRHEYAQLAAKLVAPAIGTVVGLLLAFGLFMLWKQGRHS